MRISFRSSGGRGEYEISGETSDGLSAKDMLNKQIVFRIADGWIVKTGVYAVRDSGKIRLRIRSEASDMQIQRQLAVALLLPSPVRSTTSLETSGAHIFDDFIADDVEVNGDEAIFSLDKIVLRDKTATTEISIPRRAEQVRELWNRKDELTPDSGRLLLNHKARVTTGDPIRRVSERIYRDLAESISTIDDETRMLFIGSGDLLPALQSLANTPITEPLFKVDLIPIEEVELKRRTVKAWKRWANARGSIARRFREDVRKAYRSTCFMCGNKFPATILSSAGVDAAHILPWRTYELDEVRNGLCLCKTHHWAFDEGLLQVRESGGKYYIEIPTETKMEIMTLGDDFSLRAIESVEGEIPSIRLPEDPLKWPRREFLEILNGLQAKS